MAEAILADSGERGDRAVREPGVKVYRWERDRAVARQAWEGYAAVILCADEDEMVGEADRIASEHVQLMAADPDRVVRDMRNCGALFLGAHTNVACGNREEPWAYPASLDRCVRLYEYTNTFI